MQDYFIFDEQDLERIGIVCQKCGTEAVFDLKKDQTANQPHQCPGCDNTLLDAFVSEARKNYNWITWYKKVREIKKDVGVRFYFKRP